MIKTIRHRGLKRLIEKNDRSKLNPQHIERIRRILTRLQAAQSAEDMGLPGYGLHPLKGDLRGFWAVEVSGNWRIVFRIEGGDAFDVDLIDYH